MAHYEIEVKTLLGEKENADRLKEKMRALDPSSALTSSHKQLNHYFENGDVEKLLAFIAPHLSTDQFDKLLLIVEKAAPGGSFSVRTRQKSEQVLLVVKASVDAGTSANTVSRLEFEEEVNNLSLADLDELLQSAGYKYQAKWSRDREEYSYKGLNVCIDKNAGYGYLAEFEKVVEDEKELVAARIVIDFAMAELGLYELPQDRLERMFAYYNSNWPSYYGTEKVFVVE